MDESTHLGQVLMAYRREHGLEQGDLAKRMNLPRRTIASLETGANAGTSDRVRAALYKIGLGEKVAPQVRPVGIADPLAVAMAYHSDKWSPEAVFAARSWAPNARTMLPAEWAKVLDHIEEALKTIREEVCVGHEG